MKSGRTALAVAALLSSRFAAGAVFPEGSFTRKAAGSVGASFLKVPPGARSMGMAEAAAAGVEGPEAIFFNPAGLARHLAPALGEVRLGYNNLLEGAHSGALAYSFPTGSGVGGIGLVYFSQLGQTAYTSQGDAAGSFSAGDLALSGAYAGAVGRLLLGGGLKVIRSFIDNAAGVAAAVDLGAQFLRLTEAGDGAVDVGASVLNLGSPLKVGEQSDPLPFHTRLGIQWHTTPYIITAFDYNFPLDNDPYFTMGLEAHTNIQRPKPWKASFRGGYNHRYSRKVEGFSGVTLGGGLDFERFVVDYAWVPFGDIGSTNRFWLGYRF